MSVCKVYTPARRLPTTVQTAAKGADLFVALMHGNGYPHETSAGRRGCRAQRRQRRHRPRPGPRTPTPRAATPGSSTTAPTGSVRYLHLAPNGIVILSHMCNTAGNSEDADRIPDYGLAIDHVDNFAQGFLASTSYPVRRSPERGDGAPEPELRYQRPQEHAHQTLHDQSGGPWTRCS